ncbi:MAG: efflux RND transporter permease subunit [Deltaproteobacteria bacterium]|nr:efflux RND transporter permease subunit [Deltaproteobacteria bacterium]
MTTLSDISIKNSVFAWMLMAALILFGWISFGNMGLSQMPDVDFPVVNIDVTYEGAAPEIMETDVVDIIEDAVMTVEGIRSISSSATQESADITIEFELDRDIDAALQEVQTKIAQAQRRLPENIDPPVVTKTNPEDQPIMWVALSADRPLRELIFFARDHIRDRLQTVSGVGDVWLGGYVEPNLRVWLDPAKLEKYELTVKDVVDAIEREHVEVPAGRIETAVTELNLRSLGEAATPEDFAGIRIDRRGGRPIYTPLYLGDIAKIELGLADIRRISRSNGVPAIGLGIRKQRGSNAVAVARGVKERLVEIKKTLPEGYDVNINFDSTKFIEDTTDEMSFTLLLSALLTAVVCLFFLASWGSTFNVLLAIPTSIVGSFLFLYFFGFTLNTFTLLGLILAIGIVVDDAIMVLENIVRHKEMGKDPVTASRDGAREITSAATATTLAVIAIFIPVIFMSGVIGKFFFQVGITMSVAVGLSLVEALTLTPMRASRFLTSGHREGKFEKLVGTLFGELNRAYARWLEWGLSHRWTVVTAALAFFVVSFACLPFIKKEFIPAQDQSSFLIRVQTPLGSSLEYTDEKFMEIEKILSSRPEIRRYYAAIGGFGGGDVNTGMIFVSLNEPGERPVAPPFKKRPSQADMMTLLRTEIAKIPDVRPTVQDLSMRGFSAQRGFPVEFTIRGPDWHKLTGFSQALLKKMENNPHFTDADTDYQHGQPEIQITPIRSAANARKVSIEDIGQTIGAAMGGVRAGKFTEAGHRSDIRVRLTEGSRQTTDDIGRLMVRNQGGELIRLSDLVELKEQKTLKDITRKDRERAIGLYANVASGGSQAKAIKEAERLAKEILPAEYRIVLSGTAQTFQESFSSLTFAIYLGVIVAYMVLGTQYNSFLHPITVLLALPFSLSGAWIALLVTNKSLNIFSFIGLILLMGIVKKNSIMLVDFANRRRREGMKLREALMIACPQRLRPILMTSFATLAAAIPPALALGPGSETRVPMATVVIGGVIVSTFLTLFVVPCAYSLMARFERRQTEQTGNG